MKTSIAVYRATWCTFKPKLKKIKKSTLNRFLIFFQKQKFLIFQEEKFFFYFRIWTFLPSLLKISGGNFPSSKIKKTHSEKVSFYFRKCNFLTPSLKSSYISEGNLQRPKIKNFFYFGKLNFLALRLKRLKKFYV